MVKIISLLILSLTALSCSGGGSGKKDSKSTTNIYELSYIYPDNPLTPGQGSTEVYAVGVSCKNSKGEVVDDSFCPGISEIDLLSAPTQPYLAPAGPLEVPTPNSQTSSVTVYVDQGVKWEELEDNDRLTKLQPLVTCSSGYTLNFRGDCVLQGYSYSYGNWPTNNLSPCQGSQSFTRTYICIDDVTGNSVDYFFCTGSPNITTSYLSPAGNGTMTGVSGDVLNISCQEGKTSLDIGNGAVVNSVSSCGAQRHLASPSDLTCTPNSYIASDIQYPVNDMAIGDGQREVTAISFNECRTTHDNSVVNLSFCSGVDLSAIKEIQLSPAGVITGVNEDGDNVSYAIPQGGTKSSSGTIISVISCATNRHTENGACVPDTFTASNFTFPLNDMSAGQGERTVNATSFNTCTRDHDGLIMADTSPCTMPAVLPTQTQLAPADDLFIAIENAVGGGVSISLPEGSNYLSLSDEDKLAVYGPLIVCESGFEMIGGQCIGGIKQIVAGSSNFACAILKDNRVKCWGNNAQGQLGVGSTSPAKRGTAQLTSMANLKVKKLSAENFVVCGITLDDDLVCWGGSGTQPYTSANTNSPTVLSSLGKIKDVSVGSGRLCVIDLDDYVKCLGSGLSGQMGTGVASYTNKTSLTNLSGNPKAKKISVSNNVGCYIGLDDDYLYCWGNGQNYGTGQSTTSNTLSPARTSTQIQATDVSIGGSSGMAIDLEGKVYSWGMNDQGQAGRGNITPNVQFGLASAINGLGVADSLVARDIPTSCVFMADKRVMCVGGNPMNYGTGTGSTYSATPVELLPSMSNIKKVTMSTQFTAVLDSSGEGLLWGNNNWGFLLKGTTTANSSTDYTPIVIPNID